MPGSRSAMCSRPTRRFAACTLRLRLPMRLYARHLTTVASDPARVLSLTAPVASRVLYSGTTVASLRASPAAPTLVPSVLTSTAFRQSGAAGWAPDALVAVYRDGYADESDPAHQCRRSHQRSAEDGSERRGHGRSGRRLPWRPRARPVLFWIGSSSIRGCPGRC